MIDEIPQTIDAVRHRYPQYPWNGPAADAILTKHAVPDKVAVLGSVPRQGRPDTRWNFPNTLYHALHWYCQQLQWDTSPGCKITAFALLCDFEAAAGVTLANTSTGECLTARSKLSTFIALLKRAETIHDAAWIPGTQCTCSALTPLGLQRQAYAYHGLPKPLVPNAFPLVCLHYQAIRAVDSSWDWVVPTPVNEPLCTVDLASSPPMTWANRLRESAGLEPTFKTAWSDKARDERIAKHNACAERKSLHVVKLCDPPVPVGLTGRDFSAWIQEVQCLVCTACSKLHKLKELGNITKDKCDGRPGRHLAEGEPLLKRLASEARNAATTRHTGGIEKIGRASCRERV